MAIRTLIDLTTPRRNNPRAIKLPVQRIGLTRIDHKQQLAIPSLLPHLLERVRQIPTPNLLAVLEFQELVPAVAGHVDEDVTAGVGAEAFGAGEFGGEAVGEEADEAFDCYFVAAVVDFDVVAVEVEGAVGVVVDGAGEGVAWVAGHVVREHEDDL